jgi:glutamate racemase
MIDRFIAVIDSGIGGISLLKMMVKELPHKNYIYLGDTVNAPYGNKSIRNLLEITMKNIDILKQYKLDAIVLGCNTLSVNLIGDIAAYSGVPVFGVFPPIERSMVVGEKTLLLSTCATAKKIYWARRGRIRV